MSYTTVIFRSTFYIIYHISTFHLAPSRLFRHQPPWCARWGLLCNIFCRWCATHVALAASLEVVDSMQMSMELTMNFGCRKLCSTAADAIVLKLYQLVCSPQELHEHDRLHRVQPTLWWWGTSSALGRGGDGVKWPDAALGSCGVRQISWLLGHLAVVPWNVYSIQSLAAAPTNSSSTWVDVSCDFECALTWYRGRPSCPEVKHHCPFSWHSADTRPWRPWLWGDKGGKQLVHRCRWPTIHWSQMKLLLMNSGRFRRRAVQGMGHAVL